MTSPAEVAPEGRLAAPNRSPPRRPPVTQLEFRQAMRDFRSMFPEMEAVVIEAVLRANGGAVDASIDQLLAMATDNDNERLRTELEATENAEAPPHYSPPAPTPPPSYQQATSTHTTNTTGTTGSVAAPTTGQTGPPSLGAREEARAWKPPLLGPLPPGFLRISRPHHRPSSPPQPQAVELSAVVLQQRMAENARQQRRLSAGGGGNAEADAQLLEDERMAILLQNQEFVRQLQSDPDFVRTLNRDIQNQEMERSAGLVPDDGRPAEAASEEEPWVSLPHTEETDAAFRERLKNMGKASRRKFAQLARLFHRTKKCNFRQMLGDAANPSRDNLLLHEDPGSSEEDAEARARINQEQRPAQPIKSGPGGSPLGGDSR